MFITPQKAQHSLFIIRFVPPSLTTTQNSFPEGGQSFPGGIPVYPELRWALSALRLPPPLSLSWRDRTLFRLCGTLHNWSSGVEARLAWINASLSKTEGGTQRVRRLHAVGINGRELRYPTLAVSIVSGAGALCWARFLASCSWHQPLISTSLKILPSTRRRSPFRLGFSKWPRQRIASSL